MEDGRAATRLKSTLPLIRARMANNVTAPPAGNDVRICHRGRLREEAKSYTKRSCVDPQKGGKRSSVIRLSEAMAISAGSLLLSVETIPVGG